MLALSVYIYSQVNISSCYFEPCFLIGFYVLQITPMKESSPDLERATVIQVSTQQVSSHQEPRSPHLDAILVQAVGL